MKKERTLLGMGIWIAVLPFLGFPNTWRKILFVISGLVLIYLATAFRQEYKKRSVKHMENNMHPFMDNIENA